MSRSSTGALAYWPAMAQPAYARALGQVGPPARNGLETSKGRNSESSGPLSSLPASAPWRGRLMAAPAPSRARGTNPRCAEVLQAGHARECAIRGRRILFFVRFRAVSLVIKRIEGPFSPPPRTPLDGACKALLVVRDVFLVSHYGRQNSQSRQTKVEPLTGQPERREP